MAAVIPEPVSHKCVPWCGTARRRRLTAGEVAIVQSVFGQGVDVTAVRVHNHGYPLLAGRQPSNTAVTPNGQLYFPEPSYRADFSAAPDLARRWFVHEMAHVWQHQLGYPVALRGAMRWTVRYTYRLDEHRRLCDYDMEQQGEVIADYYYLRVLGRASIQRGHETHNRHEPYGQVLEAFLARPTDRANLPRW